MKTTEKLKKPAGYALLLLAALILPLVIRTVYNQNVLILMMVYAVLGSGWNVLSGYAGQNSFGNAMFFAIGAYTSTVLLLYFNITPWVGMIVGVILAVIFAALIGIPCFRLQKYYFTLATIALLQIMNVLVSKQRFLGGAVGLNIRVRESSFFWMQFKEKLPFYYIILGILIIVLIVMHYVNRSKLGYYLRTITMNQDAAESLGVSVRTYKTIAICLGAAFTAVGGTFYAQYVLFVDPVSIISADKSMLMALVAVFGGMGTIWGPVIGACILIPIAEYSRTLIGGTGSGIDMIVYGLLMLIMVLYQPRGMIGIFAKVKARFAKSENAVDGREEHHEQ